MYMSFQYKEGLEPNRTKPLKKTIVLALTHILLAITKRIQTNAVIVLAVILSLMSFFVRILHSFTLPPHSIRFILFFLAVKHKTQAKQYMLSRHNFTFTYSFGVHAVCMARVFHGFRRVCVLNVLHWNGWTIAHSVYCIPSIHFICTWKCKTHLSVSVPYMMHRSGASIRRPFHTHTFNWMHTYYVEVS